MIDQLLARVGLYRRDDRSHLERATGISDVEWVLRCQQLVADTFVESDDPDHPHSDPVDWIRRLVDEVVDGLPAEGHYDENMATASRLVVILASWCRVHYAKTQDPRRPIALRQKSYRQWQTYIHAVFACLADPARDPDYFPSQDWDHPYAAGATDGSFV